jgi:hypothetical protein
MVQQLDEGTLAQLSRDLGVPPCGAQAPRLEQVDFLFGQLAANSLDRRLVRLLARRTYRPFRDFARAVLFRQITDDALTNTLIELLKSCLLSGRHCTTCSSSM